MASLPQSDSLWLWAAGFGDSTDFFVGIGKRSERRHMASCIPCLTGNDVPSRSFDPDVLLRADPVLLFRRVG